MRAELVHTSLPRGLDGGTGFVVAARTGGMPRALVDALSALSGLPESWPGATDLERSLQCTRRIEWQGEPLWVASVIRPCGLDHTGRGNRIAHHRTLDADELERACPIALLQDASRWHSCWSGAPRELDTPAVLPRMRGSESGPDGWDRAFGAGVLQEARESGLRSGLGAWLVLPSGMDRLGLLAELVASLPAEARWSRAWSTRAIRPSAAGAPTICVIDEREPALAGIGSAPWVIRVSTLQPREIAVRHVDARADAPTASRDARELGARVNWSPAARLGVAASNPDPEVSAGESATSAVIEQLPREGVDPSLSIRVRFEPRAGFRWGGLVWLAVCAAVAGALLWILLRGPAS